MALARIRCGCLQEKPVRDWAGCRMGQTFNRPWGNGAGAMATLRTAALNLLRLAGYQSTRAGIQAVMHDITALLAMVKRQPKPNPF